MLSRSARAWSEVSTGVLPRLTTCLRAAHRMGRIGGEDAAGHQPVETHADRRQMLLHRRLLELLAERLDIGGDMERLDVHKLTELMTIAPSEEPRHGVRVDSIGRIVSGLLAPGQIRQTGNTSLYSVAL